ncbi:hypothetical protein ACH8E3_05890 [Paenibacillus sp. CMAA1364]
MVAHIGVRVFLRRYAVRYTPQQVANIQVTQRKGCLPASLQTSISISSITSDGRACTFTGITSSHTMRKPTSN